MTAISVVATIEGVPIVNYVERDQTSRFKEGVRVVLHDSGLPPGVYQARVFRGTKADLRTAPWERVSEKCLRLDGSVAPARVESTVIDLDFLFRKAWEDRHDDRQERVEVFTIVLEQVSTVGHDVAIGLQQSDIPTYFDRGIEVLMVCPPAPGRGVLLPMFAVFASLFTPQSAHASSIAEQPTPDRVSRPVKTSKDMQTKVECPPLDSLRAEIEEHTDGPIDAPVANDAPPPMTDNPVPHG